MGIPVILTPRSPGDLREIAAYIAQDSRERAVGLGSRLIDRALSVGAFPGAGRMEPEERDPAVREVIQERYRIIYEVLQDPPRVYILRFWHGARGAPEVKGAAEQRDR
jgi:toxin ParE1/3/4